MGFMVFSVSFFVFVFILLIFNRTIKKESLKKQRIKSLRDDLRYLDVELEKTFYQRFFVPAWKKIAKSFSKLAKNSIKIKTRNLALERQLSSAGIHLGVQEYKLLHMLVILGIMSVGLISAFLLKTDDIIKLLLVLFSLIATIAIPRYYLKSRIKKRKQLIQNQMPDVMDVLSVSIEAGLGFDAALLKVVDKLDGPLIDEFNQVYREIKFGLSRRDAIIGLGQRNSVNELQTFATAVVQSEQFGTPIRNVLKDQAKQLRESRKQMAQEKGMKAPVKMMLPMVLFIFPVIFIILLGPTVIRVISEFN